MNIKLLWRVAILTIGLVASHAALAASPEAMPDFYAEPGLNPSRAYSQLTDFDNVDPFTGKLQLHHTDIFIPGNGGLNLEVGRSNTSGDGWVIGNAWTTGFGYVYRKANTFLCATGFVSNMSNPVLVLQDGSRHILSDSDNAAYLFITNQYWKATCETNGNGLIVTSPEGTRYDMFFSAGDTTYQKWYVTKITDRKGNWINITYQNPNGNGAIVTGVNTSDGRTLTYSYIADAYGYRRLSSISDGTSTWGYSYIDGTTIGLSVGTYLLQTVTLPDNTTWSYTYNGNLDPSAGSYKIKSVTTPQGGSVNYTYGFAKFNSSSGYTQDEVILSRSIPGVGTWNYSYAPSTGVGVLDTTTVAAPNGLQTVYKHYGYNTVWNEEVWKIGLLSQKTIGAVQTENYGWTPLIVSSQNDARSFTWTTKVDSNFNHATLTSKVISRNGASYSTTYSGFDGYGNPSTATESGPNGGSRTTILTYNTDTAKWVLHQVQNESFTGSSITRLFDANHNLTSITVNGVTTSHTYYADGNKASTTFPRGLTHSYSNHYRGIPQTESQPEGISITRVVSNAGNITSERNPRGYTTSYAYDGLNRPTSITYPTNNFVSISYSATSKTAARGGLVESTTYDGFGRPTNVTLGGIATTYQYDALGRMTFKSNPGSASGTSYSYDALGRVVTITQADGTSRSHSYGAASVAVTDERANTTTYTYRAYGDPDQKLLMSIVAPVASANVTIARNAQDLVTSVTQNNLTRTYGYNANFYLASVVNPETGTTTYGRDAAGNLTSRAVGTSGTTSYTYDLQNRLVSTAYTGITTPVTQTYTKTNKLASVSSASTTRSYTYDPNDNLIGEVLTIDGISLSAGYGYTGNDQLSSITYPYSGRTVTFSPDVLGRPTAVSGYVSNVTYWPSGQVNQINYANGVVTSYGQNSRLWPTTFVTQLGTSTPYVNSSYTYDYVGNLTNIADTANPNFNRTFAYDTINRLTGVNGPWGNGTISYDGSGNILTQSYGTTTWANYTYDTTNKLAAISGGLRTAAYTYDSYGDIVSDGNGKTYTYDGAPNLTGFADSVNGTSIAHVYDGLNQRARVNKNGVTTYEFNGANGKLLAEYTPSQTNKLVEYFYLGSKRIAQRLSNQ